MVLWWPLHTMLKCFFQFHSSDHSVAMTMLEDFRNQMEDIHTLRLGQNQFEDTTWQQLSGENLHSAT